MTQDPSPLPPGIPESFVSLEERPLSRKAKRRAKYAHQRRHTPWVEQKRSVRSSQTVSMRWRILTDPNGAGVFTTHDILPGSTEWPGEPPGTWTPHAWADFFFLSRRPTADGVFYNAMALTALEEACEAIEEMAREAIAAQMSEEDRQASRIRMFTRRLSGGGREIRFPSDQGLESLGGLTRYGAMAQWLRERWKDLPGLAPVRPRAQIDREYAFGVGLHLTTAEISVDTLSLPRIIAEFLDRGEVPYEDDPVDLERHLDLLQARMRAALWRWDARQATFEGREIPDPDEDAINFLSTQTNAVRV